MHVAVALGYALGFMLLREVSLTHWLLFAGLRLSVLLLAPYRFWPALVLGELIPLTAIAVGHSENYGLLWSLLYVIPPIAVTMPIVYGCRQYLGLFDDQGRTNIFLLLFCSVLAAALWTLINLVTLSETRLPPNYPTLSFTVYAARWFVGNFVGILTVVPAVLSFREMRSQRGYGIRRILSSSLVIDLLTVITPSLVLLVILGSSGEQESLRQACRMVMFLPVVWLALRHGWHGVAFGATAASIAIILTMPEKYDAGTLQAQVFMAFAITTMLLLGHRIASLSRPRSMGHGDARFALALAQRNMLLGEMQLQHASHALESIREGVQVTCGELLDGLQHLLPASAEREFRLWAAGAQQQLFCLADSLHPVVLREHGLAAALRQGAIARALDESGIGYWCEAGDYGVNDLDHGLQIALYRSVCECVAYLGVVPGIGRVHIRLRVGQWRSHKWVYVRIDGIRGGSAMRRDLPGDLSLRLAVSGAGLEATKDRVGLYGGLLRMRSSESEHRINILARDVGVESVVA